MLLIQEADALAFLHPLSVREIWGVGKVTEARLHSLGLATIGQLAAADPAVLERELGSWGPLLYGLANGQDLRSVEGDRARKSYGEENTFGVDAVDAELIQATVVAHAETVARRLRKDGRQGRTVTLKFRPSGPDTGFRLLARAHTLVRPTDDGATIARVAQRLWDEEPEHPPLRLLGVQISGLDGDRPVQLGLFSGQEDDRSDALNQALDNITARLW